MIKVHEPGYFTLVTGNCAHSRRSNVRSLFVLLNHRLMKKDYSFVDSDTQNFIELQVTEEVQESHLCFAQEVRFLSSI